MLKKRQMANRIVSVDKWGPVFWLLVLVFSSAASVKATTLTFTGATGSVTLNVSDTDATPGYSNVNAVIDPYEGMLGSNPVLIWCVDPDHEVNTGDNWPVYINTPTSFNAGQTYLGSLPTYEEMAWLITQFPGSSTTTEQELQAAIWLIAEGETTQAAEQASGAFTVNVPISNTVFWNSLYGTNGYVTTAPSHLLTSGFEILSDTAGPNGTDANGTPAKQEFIVMTPEPSTLLLLGVGLLSLILLASKRPSTAASEV
jgi:hypothetical protein